MGNVYKGVLLIDIVVFGLDSNKSRDRPPCFRKAKNRGKMLVCVHCKYLDACVE